jgi:hypothetical protein
MKLTTEKVKESYDVHNRNSNTLYQQNQTKFIGRDERRKEHKNLLQCTHCFFGFILPLLTEEIFVLINFNQYLQIIMTLSPLFFLL